MHIFLVISAASCSCHPPTSIISACLPSLVSCFLLCADGCMWKRLCKMYQNITSPSICSVAINTICHDFKAILHCSSNHIGPAFLVPYNHIQSCQQKGPSFRQYLNLLLQAFRQIGCEVIAAPQRTEPPPVADVRYVSLCSSQLFRQHVSLQLATVVFPFAADSSMHNAIDVYLHLCTLPPPAASALLLTLCQALCMSNAASTCLRLASKHSPRKLSDTSNKYISCVKLAYSCTFL